jgi:hypothetical protein
MSPRPASPSVQRHALPLRMPVTVAMPSQDHDHTSTAGAQSHTSEPHETSQLAAMPNQLGSQTAPVEQAPQDLVVDSVVDSDDSNLNGRVDSDDNAAYDSD